MCIRDSVPGDDGQPGALLFDIPGELLGHGVIPVDVHMDVRKDCGFHTFPSNASLCATGFLPVRFSTRWQAQNRPPSNSRSWGFSVLQRSSQAKHRVWKGQPEMCIRDSPMVVHKGHMALCFNAKEELGL